jgi:hypothetical protein
LVALFPIAEASEAVRAPDDGISGDQAHAPRHELKRGEVVLWRKMADDIVEELLREALQEHINDLARA